MAAELALTVRKEIHNDVLECEAHQLIQYFHNPVLFDLSNGHPPLFVSVLLHGNEITGWDVMREYIKNHDMSQPHNSLVLYVGNVDAAAQNQRALDGQQDFNRIWYGIEKPAQRHAQRVVEIARSLEPRFALDIHNNTGKNPAYSVLTHRKRHILHAARLFSDIALFSTVPHPIISRRLNEFCPALTIEVGLPGRKDSFDRTYAFVKTLLKEDFQNMIHPEDLAMYWTVARVEVETELHPNFDTFPELNPTLESMNFNLVPAGTQIATNSRSDWSLRVYDNALEDVTDKYLVHNGSNVYIQNDVVLGMYTQHKGNAYKDCLCYFLQANPSH